MERVLYTGPDEQVNHELAAATGGPLELEHGCTYEVNASLADRLCASSQHFERVGGPSKPELVERATELGVDSAGKLNKQALIAAIAAAEAARDAGGITDDEVIPDA